MPRAPSSTTWSPASAARLARETAAIPLTPARQVVLREAARLWCRDLAFPTARRLARSVCRAPSTVLIGFETMPRIHAELIRREWDLFAAHRSSPDPADWMPGLLRHLQALGEVDRAMFRLPGLVHAAVGADAPWAVPGPVSPFSLAVHLVAAFAEPAVEVPSAAQLRRIILAGLSAIAIRAEDDPTSEGRAA